MVYMLITVVNLSVLGPSTYVDGFLLCFCPVLLYPISNLSNRGAVFPSNVYQRLCPCYVWREKFTETYSSFLHKILQDERKVRNLASIFYFYY